MQIDYHSLAESIGSWLSNAPENEKEHVSEACLIVPLAQYFADVPTVYIFPEWREKGGRNPRTDFLLIDRESGERSPIEAKYLSDSINKTAEGLAHFIIKDIVRLAVQQKGDLIIAFGPRFQDSVARNRLWSFFIERILPLEGDLQAIDIPLLKGSNERVYNRFISAGEAFSNGVPRRICVKRKGVSRTHFAVGIWGIEASGTEKVRCRVDRNRKPKEYKCRVLP